MNYIIIVYTIIAILIVYTIVVVVVIVYIIVFVVIVGDVAHKEFILCTTKSTTSLWSSLPPLPSNDIVESFTCCC